MARLNVSIPDEVLSRLDVAAKKLGLSRSSYLTMAAAEKMKQDDVMDLMPKLMEQMKLGQVIKLTQNENDKCGE